jgi:hypothetical protein
MLEQPEESVYKMKCTACGSSSLVEGTLMGSDGSSVAFYASDLPSLKRVFGFGSREIRAYGCVHCQNLQFNVAFSESDLERYQEFEGEQPDVLERINSNPKKLAG